MKNLSKKFLGVIVALVIAFAFTSFFNARHTSKTAEAQEIEEVTYHNVDTYTSTLFLLDRPNCVGITDIVDRGTTKTYITSYVHATIIIDSRDLDWNECNFSFSFMGNIITWWQSTIGSDIYFDVYDYISGDVIYESNTMRQKGGGTANIQINKEYFKYELPERRSRLELEIKASNYFEPLNPWQPAPTGLDVEYFTLSDYQFSTTKRTVIPDPPPPPDPLPNNEEISLAFFDEKTYLFVAEETNTYNFYAGESVIISIEDPQEEVDPEKVQGAFGTYSCELIAGKTYLLKLQAFAFEGITFTFSYSIGEIHGFLPPDILTLRHNMNLGLARLQTSTLTYDSSINSILNIITDSSSVMIEIYDNLNGNPLITSTGTATVQINSGVTYYIVLKAFSDTWFILDYNHELQSQQTLTLTKSVMVRIDFTPKTTKQYTFNVGNAFTAIMIYDQNNALKGNAMNTVTVTLNANQTYSITIMALNNTTVTLTYN